ncbi:hypothetical protein SLEP1_g8230 [Rubroshorea leprosula]|uniref:tRNA-dihydrouridine(16/17) synthase [NAD(P)(+)] n=1 Tax=Rubroshorea leprosula TaxID=152421 RepID=A0AAV5I0X4_9ROSI|nr:hypothetical protein SLEP1_g8230 [Rubroshorea leprosula]
MLELLGSPTAQACWSRFVLPPSMTLRDPVTLGSFLLILVARARATRFDAHRGSPAGFEGLLLLDQIRRPSFSSGGYEGTRAKATRFDTHRGSPTGSEGLLLPDRLQHNRERKYATFNAVPKFLADGGGGGGGGGGDGLAVNLNRLFMKVRAALPLSVLNPLNPSIKSLLFHSNPLMALAQTGTVHFDPPANDDELICGDLQQQQGENLSSSTTEFRALLEVASPPRCLSGESRVERAWAHWNKLGRPKLIVAPMVDNSELPFRMLCRKYGAEAAYTPMLHSRIFTENEKYRNQEFTTCKEDRPLFVQFCANDPDILLEAAKRVEPYCDYVDINLGCPQRIARRGNYGAFLMDNLPLVKSLVEKLALNLNVPVSCKIRVFPNLQDTLNYAKMLEEAGCSLLAVHGRTRDEKDGKKFRADWNAIKAVKDAVKIPVLANGNIRHMDDVWNCVAETGAEGVLSAESLLENPALFAGFRTAEWVAGNEENIRDGNLDQADLVVEYLKLCEKYPVPWRMVRSHVHKLLGDWFKIQLHVRDDLNAQSRLTFEFLNSLVDRLRELGVRIPLYQKDTHLEKTSADGLNT